MNPRVALGLVVLGVAGVGSWVGLSGEKVAAWNDRIVATCERFGSHGEEFARSIKPWASGARMDVSSFKVIDDAFETYSKRTREIAEQVRADRPPDDPLCRDFHASLVGFADFQVRSLDEFGKVVDLMRKYNQPSDDERREVADRLKVLVDEGNALIQRARTKQAEMAKKHRIRILNERNRQTGG